MRKAVEGTEFEGFVADGTRGGRHNYGVAVDLTIATLDGTPLDMGAGVDDFTEAASVKGTADSSDPATRTVKVYRDYINNLAERGVISREAAANRILLIEVMHEAGLYPYRREWWHFEEIISITTTRSKYELLDF
jgi:D-alanyl-D-alanine dipeptidase